MIVRIWRTQFDPSQKQKLLAYANEVSLPVLSSREGVRDVLFFAEGEEWITMTTWSEQTFIDRLSDDSEYQKIVSGIEQLGVLGEKQSVETFRYEGGTIV